MYDATNFLSAINNIRQSAGVAGQQIQQANLQNQLGSFNNEIAQAKAAREPDILQAQINYQNALSNVLPQQAKLYGAQANAANMGANMQYLQAMKLKAMIEANGGDASWINIAPPGSMGSATGSAVSPSFGPSAPIQSGGSPIPGANVQNVAGTPNLNQPALPQPNQANLANNLSQLGAQSPQNQTINPNINNLSSNPGVNGQQSALLQPQDANDPLLLAFQNQKAQLAAQQAKTNLDTILTPAKVPIDKQREEQLFEGTPQMQAQRTIDEKRMDNMTSMNDQSVQLQQMLNEFNGVLHNMSPSDFNAIMTHSGVSGALNAQFQRLVALSAKMQMAGAHVQGIPATALRSNMELSNLAKGYGDPHQLYDTLTGDMGSVQNMLNMNYQNMGAMSQYWAKNGTTHGFSPQILQQVDSYTPPQAGNNQAIPAQGNTLSGQAPSTVTVRRSDGITGTIPAAQLQGFLSVKNKDGSPKYTRVQ